MLSKTTFLTILLLTANLCFAEIPDEYLEKKARKIDFLIFKAEIDIELSLESQLRFDYFSDFALKRKVATCSKPFRLVESGFTKNKKIWFGYKIADEMFEDYYLKLSPKERKKMIFDYVRDTIKYSKKHIKGIQKEDLIIHFATSSKLLITKYANGKLLPFE